jgi:hypothetical protein
MNGVWRFLHSNVKSVLPVPTPLPRRKYRHRQLVQPRYRTELFCAVSADDWQIDPSPDGHVEVVVITVAAGGIPR